MLFKSLEIQGFKSFANKTVLDFDTRTTAVVGSNGNGKSNIADALRWVMGEQGAKSLRGDKMEDVIFHGNFERSPMNYARVSLTIDNSDRSLAVDSDVVVITRKISRAGKSEYLINGKDSLLKEIKELLMGTGLGCDGYSIIEQDRVSEIIKARDTDRREIFEEAAGVSLALHRKSETEKMLKKVEDDIVRAQDIMRLDEERLPTLKKQSEKALQAAELTAQKKTLEISVSSANLKKKRGELSGISDEILKNQGFSENYDRNIKTAEDKIGELMGEKQKTQVALEQTRKDIESVNETLAKKNTEISLAKNDLKHNEEARNNLAERLEKAKQSDEEYNKQIGELGKEIDGKKALSEELEGKARELQKKLDGISQQNDAADAEYSALERELAAARSGEAVRELAKKQAEQTVEDIEARKREFLDNQSSDAGRLEELKKQLDEANKASEKNIKDTESAKNKLNGMELLAGGRKKRLDEVRAAFEDANSRLGECQQRHRVLSSIVSSREGYYDPVKALLRASDEGRITGIHGTVADVITVPEKYVTAIETLLKSAKQNVIVDNEDTVKRCKRYLEEINEEKATICPLTTIKGRRLNEPRLSSEDGFEGIASELVECADEYANVISYLLGATAVVDDIDTAMVIGKKYGHRFRIVTLDGQLANAGGSFTVGGTGKKNKKDDGIIKRKQELASLYAEMQTLRETVKTKNAEYERYKAEYAKFEIEYDGAGDDVRELEKEKITIDAEIGRLSGLIEQLEQQGRSSKAVLDGYDEQISRQNEIISDADRELSELSEKIKKLNQKYEDQTGERTEAQKKIDELSEQIKQANSDKLKAEHEADLLRQQLKNLEDNRKALVEDSEGFKKEQEKLDESDREINERIERIKLEIKEESGSIAEKNDEITALTNKISGLEKEMEEHRQEVKDATADKQKFLQEIARLEERKANEQRKYDEIVAMLFKSYGITVSEAEAQADELEDLRAAELDLDALNKKLSALGEVNPGSIEEYKTVSQRYEFQSRNLRDINDSKKELETLLDGLTKDIKEQFLYSFNEINRHFQDIFAEIFGAGAHAELELTNPDDVMNTGIEIKAAPPGKVIKNLISLSGGERALVAITIFFAILRHRPTPFCMLDEVDAPLDDINVEKYIRYVNQFSAHTQLMLISHRRGTIEGCKVLYGVFMQEKGVSRLIRQELTDDLEGVE